MVSLVDRFNFTNENEFSKKTEAFLCFINGREYLNTTESEVEIDKLYYLGINSFIKENKNNSFKEDYDSLTKRQPSENSPVIRDDYLLYVLICCVEKFTLDRSWLLEVLNRRSCSTDECRKLVKTFQNILNSNFESTDNIASIIILFQYLLNYPLLSSKYIKNEYRLITFQKFPIYKSDLINFITIKAFDIIIEEADILEDGIISKLKRFNTKFIKTTHHLAVTLHIIISLCIIGIVVAAYFLSPEVKEVISGFESIFGFLGVGIQCFISWTTKKWVIDFFEKKIRRFFGYTLET